MTNWDRRSGLPQNTAVDLAQTPDGYLWLGTESGLVRFDGSRFVTFDKDNTPHLGSSYIQAVHASADGSLWVGTTAGAVRMRDQPRRFTSADGLPEGGVTAIHRQRDGTVWFGTTSGVRRMTNGRITPVSLLNSGEPAVRAFAESDDGHLFIATDSGLFTAADNHVSRVAIDPTPPVPALSLLVRDDELWVGWAGAGITTYNLRDGSLRTITEGLSDLHVYALTADGESVLAGTNGGGLHRITGGRIESFPRNVPLGELLVRSILRDRDGNIWAGTVGKGIYRLTTPMFTTIGAPEGLSRDIALAVFGAGDGSLWVGTAGRGVNQITGDNIRTWSAGDGLPSDVVLALAEDRRRRMWIGTSGGIAVIEDGRVTRIAGAETLSPPIVRSIAHGRDGAVWIGLQGGGLHVLRNGALKRVAGARELGSNTVTALHKTADGNLLILTENGGASLLRNGSIERFGPPELRSLTLVAVAENPPGTFWFATGTRGLAAVADGRVAFFGRRDGLPDDEFHSVLDDGAGHLWCSSNNGLFRVAKSALASRRNHAVPVTPFGRSHGLRTEEFNGGVDPPATRSADGRLWFPTIAGVAGIDPAIAATPRTPAVPMIEQVVINGVAVAQRNAITLPAGARSIAISYTSVDLTAPELLTFRYILEGFDDGWQFAGKRRTAYYTNIPPGDYTLRIEAIGADGRRSETRSLPLTARPHLWQHPLFYATIVALLIALTVMAHQLRTRYLRERNRTLTALVEERERAAAQLREAEAHFRSLIENASDIIVALDDDGLVRYASPSIRATLGYEPSSLIGQPLLTLMDPAEPKDVQRSFRAALKEYAMASETFRVRCADGSTVLLEVRGSVHTAPDGRREVILNCRDVTERLQIRDQLERAARLAALGRLAATVSHEFNNVLMGIQPFAELLSRHSDERVRTFAGRIVGSVERGRQITSEILTYARAPEPQFESIDVRNWLTTLLPELRATAPELDITTDVPPDLFISGDPTQLTQVVINLVTNAQDSTTGGAGSLRIVCRAAPAALRSESTRRDAVEITVSDDGAGIAAEHLPHIFEPFYTTKTRKGTGLGLAIIHQIIAKHGGHISVESVSGAGTSFRLLLPSANDSEVSRPAAPSSPLPALAVRDIVLVEDHEDVSAAIAELLESEGVTVRTASTAAAAHDAVEQRVPEALIVDIGLPDTDGITLYRALIERFATMPVVFCTGAAPPTDADDLLAQPQVAFLRKPFVKTALFDALSRCTRGIEAR